MAINENAEAGIATLSRSINHQGRRTLACSVRKGKRVAETRRQVVTAEPNSADAWSTNRDLNASRENPISSR